VSDDVEAALLQPVVGVGREMGAPALHRAAARALGVVPRPADPVQADVAEEPDAEDEDNDVQAEGAAGDVVDGAIVDGAAGGDVQPALLEEEDELETVVEDRQDQLGRRAVGVPAGGGTAAAVGDREHRDDG
tara:strand:+ start:3078 stop:3473 length:396 start_codon:yes stop_codon:yes gene_type:complete